MFDIGGMMGGGGGGMMGGAGGGPWGMIANKIIGGISNAAGAAGKPMAPQDFASLQGSVISGEPAPAPTQTAQPKGGGGGASPASGLGGMLGKGIGNLDTTGGSNFLEQAKNLIGGMFQ